MPADTAIAAPARKILTRRILPIAVLGVSLLLLMVIALAVGRFHVGLLAVCRILLAQVFPVHQDWTDSAERVVVLVRLPRVLLAAIIGGGLAISGAALQATFRNPLVNPEILGVSAGASFGGALALLLGLGSAALVGGAFGFGLAALGVVFAVTSIGRRPPILAIVLAGVVTASFFSALVSLVTYLADPENQLPAIVFWLLGSLATATNFKLLIAAIPIALGSGIVLALRWRINVLSLGDEEAAALGIRPERLRWALLTAVAAIVAGSVAVSGVIGWVGLVIPHLTRMWVGPDHRILLPASLLMGASYLILIDTLARTATSAEIPLGVLTALIGAPVFFLLMHRNREQMWSDA